MYRFLLSRRWFGTLALAIVAAICCLFLARWQWHRREARLARNTIVTQNWDSSPQSLAAVVPGRDQPLSPSKQWTPVALTGRYVPTATVLVRNRPLDGEPGYRVLVPLRLSSGVLYVDRGWLPIGESGAKPDLVPAPPAGQVKVMARVRPAEPASAKTAPPGQAQSVTPAEFGGSLREAGVTAPIYTGTYAVMATESPAATRPMPVFAEPELDEGPHLSYTIQWCIFALMFVGMWIVVVRREAEERTIQEFPERARPARPRAPRDEDIEDAQVADIWTESGNSDTPSGVREAR